MILIVGASEGLGLNLVKNFISQNKKIFTISRSKNPIFDNPLVSWIQNDITKLDYDFIDNFDKSSIEAVIFTVGYFNDNDDFSLNIDEIHKIFQTNLFSVSKLIEKLITKDKLKNGSYISICSSVTTMLPRDTQVFYSAAKKGLDCFIESLRFTSLKKKKIFYVNRFIIGVLDQPMKGSLKKPPKFLAYSSKKAARFISATYNKKNSDFFVPSWWFIIKIVFLLTPKKILNKILGKVLVND
jgi:short-subunit dehydrogenase